MVAEASFRRSPLIESHDSLLHYSATTPKRHSPYAASSTKAAEDEEEDAAILAMLTEALLDFEWPQAQRARPAAHDSRPHASERHMRYSTHATQELGSSISPSLNSSLGSSLGSRSSAPSIDSSYAQSKGTTPDLTPDEHSLLLHNSTHATRELSSSLSPSLSSSLGSSLGSRSAASSIDSSYAQSKGTTSDSTPDLPLIPPAQRSGQWPASPKHDSTPSPQLALPPDLVPTCPVLLRLALEQDDALAAQLGSLPPTPSSQHHGPSSPQPELPPDLVPTSPVLLQLARELDRASTSRGSGDMHVLGLDAPTTHGSDATPVPSSDVSPALGSDVSPALGSPASPALGSDASPALGSVVSPALGSDASPALGSDASPALGSVTSPALGSDASPALGSDASPALGSDASPALGSVASPALGSDASPALGSDASPALGSDASPALGSDASHAHVIVMSEVPCPLTGNCVSHLSVCLPYSLGMLTPDVMAMVLRDRLPLQRGGQYASLEFITALCGPIRTAEIVAEYCSPHGDLASQQGGHNISSAECDQTANDISSTKCDQTVCLAQGGTALRLTGGADQRSEDHYAPAAPAILLNARQSGLRLVQMPHPCLTRIAHQRSALLSRECLA